MPFHVQVILDINDVSQTYISLNSLILQLPLENGLMRLFRYRMSFHIIKLIFRKYL